MKTKNGHYSIINRCKLDNPGLKFITIHFSRILSILIVISISFSGFFGLFYSNTSFEVSAATISSTGTKPVNGEILTGLYTFEVNDAGSATRCELRIDGTLISYMDSTGIGNPNWDYDLDTSGWSDGNHIVRYDSIGGTGGNDVVSIPVKFDNNGPEITNRSAVYEEGATAIYSGGQVRVKATVTDEVSGVYNVTCNATLIGGQQWVKMYDDGQHQDGSAFDGTYASDKITVNTIPGYHSVFIWAQDNKGNTNNQTVGVNVDNYEPTVMGIETILPAGQNAIKNGDKIRVVATAFDFKLEIIKVIVRQPLDVVLVLDNSGSMAGTKWSQLETAATAFVDTLANNDRCAIFSFNLQSDAEGVKRYQDFLQMDQVYTDQNDNIKTDIGRNLSKHVITIDDGRHLTRTNGNPQCWTPIWDCIGEAIIYAQNNHLTDHVPIVVAMSDGNDAGSVSPYYEYGSETFCPGAPVGDTNRTWGITGGTYWGSPVRSYNSVLREFDTNLLNTYTTVTFSSQPSRDGSRTGLINCSIPIFTIGLGNVPQGSNASASGYMNPATSNYRYTTEFDLQEIGVSSAGGKYYYAPSGNELNQIYQQISQEIQKFGINELGKAAPHGIQKIEADLSSVGISQMVSMFDDGKHGDASANDDIYGSDIITINSVSTGNIVFSVKAEDIAGNSNYTINSLYLDNTQPVIDNITAYFPPNRTKAQDGYSIYFSAFANDTESGLGYVYLDASNIGGGSAIPMNDEGEGNDEYAFDNVFASKNFTVATGLKSGTYTITIKVYDKAGNLAEHKGNIEIFNDVDIIMNNLVANDVISGNYPILVNISDPDGIPDTSSNPRFRIDANPWYDMSLISGSDFGGIMNTSLYLDGTHSLFVNAKDTFGAESTLETQFVIDNTPPSQATVITPIANEYIGGVYSFKCTATDAIGVKNVTITITNMNNTELVSNSTMGYNSNSGYYEFVLGSANLDDGVYNVTTYVHDHAGHETLSQTVTFFIDNTDPILILNYPKEGNIVFGIVSMNFTVNDTFLDDVEYNVDNSGWVDYLVPWNTTALSDGSHSIKIRVKDKAGHIVQETISVTIDNHNPVCILNQPAQNQFIGEIFTFRCYATDQVGIEFVRLIIFQIEEGNTTNITIIEIINTSMVYQSSTGYYEYIFDTTVQTDGNYTAYCYAKDIAGNTTYTSNTTFYIDNNAPELTINDPYNGKIIGGSFLINLTINETFLDWSRYNIDGSGWVNVATPWNTTDVLDGSHTIKIKVRDRAGHYAEESIIVIVDNNQPKCTIVTPIKNQYIEGLFTFKISASDLVQLDRVTISVFGVTVNASYNTENSYYEYSVDTTVYGDGSRYVSAMAYDVSGKIFNAIPIPFFVDNHAPGLTLNSPIDGQYVKGSVQINITVLELFEVVNEYNIDNKGWTSISVPWDTTKLNDGSHTIQVRASDKLGHVTMRTIKVVVDNKDPICIIQTPIKNQYIENTFTFKILATDEVGISKVELSLFYDILEAVYSSQTGYYEYTIDTRFLEDGKYNISARCIDNANRSVNAIPVDFRIDNKYPILRVNSPQNGIYVTGNLTLDFEVSDAFPTITEYNIDGNGWIPYQINPVWNSSTVQDGEHILEVRCTDPSDHASDQKIRLYVDNNAPVVAIHSPAEGQYIEGTFTFKFLVQDAVGIDHVEIALFGDTVQATYNSQTNYYEFSKALTSVPDGIYDISVSAYDLSGKFTTIGPTEFYVDSTAPILKIIFPLSNQIVSGTINIETIVEDEFSVKTFYNLDGSGWVPITEPWKTYKSHDGEHSLSLRSVDAAGHEIMQGITVNVDNTPPKISMVLPKENDHIGGIYTVQVYAFDTFGIDSVWLSLNFGKPFEISQNPSTGLYEIPLDTNKYDLGDGQYKLVAEARDKVGKVNEINITIFIDNSAPEINELLYPKNNAKGQIEFVLNVTDLGGIEDVLINIDGTGWRPFSKYEAKNNTYRYIWRTTKSDNGYHIFDIKTIDNLGNEETISGSLTIKNEDQDDPLGFLLEILPLIVFIVILIIIIIIFLLFRRGTFKNWMASSEDESETDEDTEDDDLSEELDEDDEFEFEFARGGAEDSSIDDDNDNDESRGTQSSGGFFRSKKKRLNEQDTDWFESEKPPSIIKESGSKQKVKPKPRKRQLRKTSGRGKRENIRQGPNKKHSNESGSEPERKKVRLIRKRAIKK